MRLCQPKLLSIYARNVLDTVWLSAGNAMELALLRLEDAGRAAELDWAKTFARSAMGDRFGASVLGCRTA